MLSFMHLALLSLLAADPVPADLVIRNVSIHDGSGKPARLGDIAIRGDRIVALGSIAVAGNPRIIDGSGLVAAPGFIDLHTHSDTPLTRKPTNANLNYLTQGVTTAVTGNCGFGPIDLAEYYKTLESLGQGANVVHQVPHNSLRQRVMGNVNRPPTADELRRMEALVEKGMQEGAWGLATGLIYTPGAYARTDELIALARVAAKHGGFYASHIRNEGVGLLTAVEEILTIGREADIPVHISHMKASGKTAWGKAADAVALVIQARMKGQRVTADQYPYIASSTSLSATLVPPQFREGSLDDFRKRLADPEQGPKLRDAIAERLALADQGARLRIASYAPQSSWQGKDLAAIAKQEQRDPLELAIDILQKGGAQIVNFNMHEEDLRLIMRQPFTATGSDGSSMVPGLTVPHPRSYGTFPRKIGHYALVEKAIPLEQAIRSASGLPADILKLPERGYLKTGHFADILVFDPETFRDQATFDKPHQYSTGVRYLLVNGKLAIDQGRPTGTLAGKVLRHGK